MTLKIIAQIISRIFAPLLTVPLAVVYLFSFHIGLSQLQRIQFLLIISAIGLLLPALWLIWFKLTGRISDWNISSRRERVIPFSILAIHGWLSIWFVHSFGLPRYLTNLMVYGVLVFTVVVVVTIWEKISLHVAGTVVFCILMNWIFNWNLVWLFFSVLPVGWSRWYLGRHTLRQIVFGVAVPLVFLTPFVPVLK